MAKFPSGTAGLPAGDSDWMGAGYGCRGESSGEGKVVGSGDCVAAITAGSAVGALVFIVGLSNWDVAGARQAPNKNINPKPKSHIRLILVIIHPLLALPANVVPVR